MVQVTALEHRLGARRFEIGHLERVQDRVRAHLEEGMPEAYFLQVERHPCPDTRSQKAISRSRSAVMNVR